ncbi:MAG: SBBP repeat-containing protein [Cytophagaceae bacterium]|nr:SBBP repeat-containing protein [Cytophagaceae bacterium]
MYNGNTNGQEEPSDIAVDVNGNVYVTGGSNGDYVTIKYSPSGIPFCKIPNS